MGRGHELSHTNVGKGGVRNEMNLIKEECDFFFFFFCGVGEMLK